MGRGGGQVVRVLAFFPTILVWGWSPQFFYKFVVLFLTERAQLKLLIVFVDIFNFWHLRR